MEEDLAHQRPRRGREDDGRVRPVVLAPTPAVGGSSPPPAYLKRLLVVVLGVVAQQPRRLCRGRGGRGGLLGGGLVVVRVQEGEQPPAADRARPAPSVCVC